MIFDWLILLLLLS